MNNAIANLLLRVRSDTDDGERGLAGLAAALQAFGAQDAEAKARIETRDARRALASLAKDMAEFANETAESKATVDTTEARVHLDALEQRLNSIDRKSVDATVDVNIAKALAKIAVLRRAMSAEAFKNDPGLEGSTPDITRQFLGLSTATTRLNRGLKESQEGPNTINRIAQAFRNARVSLGPFSISLLALGRVWLLFIPKALAFAAGIVAIGAAAAGAIAGIAGLTIAAAAAAGPLALLAIGAGARFAQATKSLQDYRNALEAVRQATRAQEDAERNLNRAQADADDAQKNLTEERRQARSTIEANIATTGAALADAEENLTVTQENAVIAQRALTDARIDATRALLDMKFAAEGAALGERRAELNLTRARNALRALGDDAPQMKLKEARLAVKEAELALKQAREDGERSQQDLNTAEDRGVEGSDQVISARQGVESANYAVVTATRDLTTAIEESNAAQKATVANSENVLSARKRLHEANRSIIDQERALKFATQDVNKAQRQLNRSQRLAAPLLTGAGRALRASIKGFRADLESMAGPAIDRIWRAIAQGLQSIGPTLRSFRAEFKDLGGVVADSIRNIFDAMASPGAGQFFSDTISAAAELVPVLTDSLISLARIFANIAQAFMPHMIEGFKDLARFLRDLASATDDASGMSNFADITVGLARSFVALASAITNALIAIGEVALGPGQNLIDWFAQVIQGFADWARTEEGRQQLKDFFDTMIPLFRGILDLLGEILEFLIQIGKIMGPSLTIMNKVFTTILSSINDILSIIGGLPAPIRAVIGGFILFRGPINIIKSLVGWIARLSGILLGRLAGALATLSAGPLLAVRGALLAVGARMVALAAAGGPIALLIAALILIVTHWDQVKNAIGGAVDRMKDWLGVTKLLQPKLDGALDAAQKLAHAMGAGRPPAGAEGPIGPQHLGEGAGKAIGAGMAEGLKRSGPAVAEAMRKNAQMLRDMLPGSEPRDASSPLRHLDKAGAAIVQNLAAGMLDGQANLPREFANQIANSIHGKPRKHGGGHHTTNHNQFDLRATGVPGGQFPSADEYMAAVSRNLRKRGLSLA